MNLDNNEIKTIHSEIYTFLKEKMLTFWYPKVLDTANGGYFTNLSSNGDILPIQEKMITTQARHIWSLAELSSLFDNEEYEKYAFYGFEFLQNKMWDEKHGGFYQIRSSEGKYTTFNGYSNEKRTDGNAYALYALSNLLKISLNTKVSSLSKKLFYWLHQNTCDMQYGGYFQFVDGEGYIIKQKHKSDACDRNEIGYKDQNSSIHMLEALSAYYDINSSESVRKYLFTIFILVRDIIVQNEGYLKLYFNDKWEPVSVKKTKDQYTNNDFALDRVSFGHDYETAYLLLDAGFKLKNDHNHKTLVKAKRLLDHSLQFGWDKNNGGFHEAGFYFEPGKCSIVRENKTWWGQAEALNILALLSRIYPENKEYLQKLTEQWNYIRTYLLDYDNGDWFEFGTDFTPSARNERKAHIWKATYHTVRAMVNTLALLDPHAEFLHYNGYKSKVNYFNSLVSYWDSLK